MGEALRKRIRQTRFESPVVEATFNLIVTADYLRQRTDSVCADYGITTGQYNVLRILRGAGQTGWSRCEIANRMLERAPDITRLIDRLESQGLVERDRSEDDRRLSISRITSRGQELLIHMQPRINTMQNDLSQRISRRDCREISRICEGIYSEDEAEYDGHPE